MSHTRVSVIVLLLQALAGFAQDKRIAPEAFKPSTQKAAVSAPARAQGDAPSRPSEASVEGYQIGPGDLMTITVWKEATLTGSYLVRSDGKISMPLVGDVQASDLTPAQLGGELEARLKEFMQNPNVTVQISQVHSKVIYLLGEVVKKGPIEMSAGMTLLQAISSAGGLTDYANAKKIYVLRTEEGKQVKIPGRYREALKGDASSNLILRAGDTIVVP